MLVVAVMMPLMCSGFMQTPTLPLTYKPTFIATTSSSRPVTLLHSSTFEREVDEMFQQYDADGSGQIDKDEFRAVVKKMKSSSRRREIISVAAATFGSLFVANGSNTFQLAQKYLRKGYLEEFAEIAQNELFPTAMLSADVDQAIAKVLYRRGFTPENTLFGHSVCSDEVNNRKEQLIPILSNRWEEGFTLGVLFYLIDCK